MHALTDVNNIKISYQPFQKKPVKQPSLELGGWGRGVGGGGGGQGWLWYECASQYFKTYPIHIPGLWKHGPIDILDRLKCWPIHILSFDFLYPFIAGCQTNITVNSLNTKRTSSLEKSLSEKYVNIPGCQKNGAFHIGILKNRVMHILFVEKKGANHITGSAEKRAIRHAHPYYDIYRKLPLPPPPRPPARPTHTQVLHWLDVLVFMEVFGGLMQNTANKQKKSSLDWNLTLSMPLWKHAYSNIKKISPPKTEYFQVKNSDIFSYFCSKHRLWVLVRIASERRF